MSHETPLITLTPKDITIILWVSRNQHYFKTSIQKKKPLSKSDYFLLPRVQLSLWKVSLVKYWRKANSKTPGILSRSSPMRTWSSLHSRDSLPVKCLQSENSFTGLKFPCAKNQCSLFIHQRMFPLIEIKQKCSVLLMYFMPGNILIDYPVPYRSWLHKDDFTCTAHYVSSRYEPCFVYDVHYNNYHHLAFGNSLEEQHLQSYGLALANVPVSLVSFYVLYN